MFGYFPWGLGRCGATPLHSSPATLPHRMRHTATCHSLPPRPAGGAVPAVGGGGGGGGTLWPVIDRGTIGRPGGTGTPPAATAAAAAAVGQTSSPCLLRQALDTLHWVHHLPPPPPPPPSPAPPRPPYRGNDRVELSAAWCAA